MDDSDLRIPVNGLPATFATAGEKPSKAQLKQQIPSPSLDGREKGITTRFVLPTLAPRGYPLDIDNLCEPLFSVLVNRAGWFGGTRSGIPWWRASKEVGVLPGCDITVSRDSEPSDLELGPLLEATYKGPLPRGGRESEVADWACSLLDSREPFPATCALACFLGFGSSRTNIGAISTGPVKSFIDCLYPILGGVPGAPNDHRIDELTVSKGLVSQESEMVVLRFWPRVRVVSRPQRGSASTGPIVGRETCSERELTSHFQPSQVMSNPCRPGSAKYIVCQAALTGRGVDQVRRDLDVMKPGCSRNLPQYISDLRSENGLDIVRDEKSISCRGRIRGA
jgi:hypothetical protein